MSPMILGSEDLVDTIFLIGFWAVSGQATPSKAKASQRRPRKAQVTAS